MYQRRSRHPSKPTIFAVLMAVSLVLILLPADFFGHARDMTQLAALPQYAITRTSEKISGSTKGIRGEPVPAGEHAQLQQEKKSLENENVALLDQVRRLQALVGGLQQLRGRADFPNEAQLIPARVVAWDAVPERDSLTLLKGRTPGVKIGDWVTSRLFSLQAGGEDGIHDDLRVLARETLVGWVEYTAPYVSRVVLLSDRYSGKVWRVHVAAVGRGRPKAEFVLEQGEPADFALQGIGDGKMRLLDINAKFVTDGSIREGDVVTSDGHDPKLPLTMVIGEIVKLEQIKKQPLLYHAVVKHRVEPKDVSEVFIVDIPR